MSDLITYDDKVRLKSQNVSEKYKVTAGDMNEIKSVVNTNVELVDEINKPENWVSVGTEEPTDGRRVWFADGKNLFDKNNPNIINGFVNGTTGLLTAPTNNQKSIVVRVNTNTTYTISGVERSTSNYGLFNDEKLVVGTSTATLYGNINNGVRTITTGENTKWLVFLLKGGTETYGYENLQLEEGTSATTYEPYIEKSINVDDEQWLNKTNLVSVGATSPTGGERVWFGKTSNLLTYSDLASYTENGISVTNNNDGTFTVNGTATADLSTAINTNFIPMSGTWKLIGCPSGGSSTTYMLSAYVGYWGTSSPNIDTGNGTNITYTGNVKVRFYIKSGTTCNNLIFKPMITYDTSKSYESFEPYVDQGIYVDNEQWYSKPKVLWTNPSPTSSFASQTITLGESITNYKYYEILYKTYKDENVGYNTGKIPVEWSTNLYGITNANDGGTRNRVRQVTINNSTQIAFASCSLIVTKGDAYTYPDNNRLIPYQILGYKE